MLTRIAQHSGRTVLATALVTSLGIFPVFLLGSMASLVRGSFPLDERQLGLAVSAFYATAALSSVPAGVVGQRLGYSRAMRLAVFGAIASLLAIALLARSWTHMVAFLIVGGAANALSKPATNMALAATISPHRQGMAFGIKQSAGPTAILLAGLALPVLGLTVGWRGAFGLGAAAGLVVLMAVPVERSLPAGARKAHRAGPISAAPLWLLAVAAGFATAAGSSLGAFYVESSIAKGFSPAVSGALLSCGGLAGIAGRVFWGWRADQSESTGLRRITTLLLGGAIGFAGIALIDRRAELLLLATVVAYGVGWAWNGLYHYAVVRVSPGAAARATGIATTGLFAGGVVGPAIFGYVAKARSYTVAWTLAAASLVTAAILVELSRAWLIRVRSDLTSP